MGQEIQSLIDTLKMGDTKARVAAADRLGFIYHPTVVPALQEAFRDPEDSVQKAAKTALLRLGVEDTETDLKKKREVAAKDEKAATGKIDKAIVYQAQKRLKELGYNPGPIDGL